ncbi:rhodanese-like domain-containing protein [Arcobacter porcinus]|uniref:Rhodanese-like domain protein n=1 Tax=Arcobacter porcinus TaxID=1935204 RepID=A0A1C0AU91_9BACT|nr:rhodanese-like domain-containing protein [Arcobacter porcinus]OCL89664.1 Rhodanese-like domain protein [Aliarcobacter thereius]OCL81843.1 Rhodanese-like domain protein [Arcobacter porcinus]OCL83958.1 Rhodanese-like domain protein [Arcobacter porcinus]OCL87152.1 Rhodanese-like domain protein [Arcobacter porcinus]OCL89761.1 Rhodanese-like domain protein [Arcobacter porcinus]
MFKIFIGIIFASATIFANDLQTTGVEVTLENGKKVTIKREDKPKECENVAFDPREVFGGEHQASKNVNDKCKRAYVTYFGKIAPMKAAPNIETYGELEVLEFILKAKTDKNLLLIDSRTENWFYHETIPSAVNVPYVYTKKSQYPDEFKEALEIFGVVEKNGKYDFSKAKTLLMFCNATWCGQSPEAMKELMAIGYPQEKMKWYRGGMQSWLSLGLTTIKP